MYLVGFRSEQYLNGGDFIFSLAPKEISQLKVNSTQLLANPLAASLLTLIASPPKQKHLQAKSCEPSRLVEYNLQI